jgi:hypothetical protein
MLVVVAVNPYGRQREEIGQTGREAHLIFLGLSYVMLGIILSCDQLALSCDQFALIVKVLPTLGAAL